MPKKLKVFWPIRRDLPPCVSSCYLLEEEDLPLSVKVGSRLTLASLLTIWVSGTTSTYFSNAREKRPYLRNRSKCKSILCKFHLFASFKFRKVLNFIVPGASWTIYIYIYRLFIDAKRNDAWISRIIARDSLVWISVYFALPTAE